MKHFFLFFVLLLAFAGTAFSQGDGSNLMRGERAVQTEQATAEDGFKLFIPNAFTPNGDNINDFYHIPNATFNQFSFTVFDRWGNKVYETKDPNFRWDGNTNGKPAPADVYVFMLEGRTNTQLAVKRSGTISIVR